MGRYDEQLAKAISAKDFQGLSDVFGESMFKAKVVVKTHWRKDPKTGKLVLIHEHEREQYPTHAVFEQGHKVKITEGKHAGKIGEIGGYDSDKQNFRTKLEDGIRSGFKVHSFEHVEKNEHTLPGEFKKLGFPSFEGSTVQYVVKQVDVWLSDHVKGDMGDYSGGAYGQAHGKAVYALKNGKHVIVNTDYTGKKFKQSIVEVPASQVQLYEEPKGPVKGGASVMSSKAEHLQKIVDKAEKKSAGEWSKQVISGEHGSNPGGEYVGPDGGHYYVKFYHNPDQAKSEHFADEFTKAMGLVAPDTSLPTVEGKQAFASKWLDKTTLQKMGGPDALEKISDKEKDEIAKLYLTACLTANWDVVGEGYDNLAKTKDGHWFCVDAGGAFKFRAQGNAKSFGPSAVEFESLLDPPVGYPYAGKVMERILPDTLAKNPQKYVDWLTDKLNHADFSKYMEMAKKAGFSDSATKELVGNIFERRDDLMKRIAQKFGGDLDQVAQKKSEESAPEVEEEHSKGAFVPAKTVGEAEDWAKANNLADKIDYTGLHLDAANGVNQAVARMLEVCPAIRQKLKFVGAGKLASGTYASCSYNSKQPKADIQVNSSFFSSVNYAAGVKSLEYGFKKKFHPVPGAKSVFDHECGHALCSYTQLSKTDEVYNLYHSLSLQGMTDQLSGYAKKDRHEFVAEAWAEYCNSDSPRQIAKKVGDLMLKKLKEMGQYVSG